jgi:hypothetical protein
MKRLTILAILCLLFASSARADDGWWDFLWRMDPKFMGPNIELHLCWDEDRVYKNCEGFFGIPALFGKGRPNLDNVAIKHEISFRFGYYHTYGELSPQMPSTAPGLSGEKYQVFYFYHPDGHIRVGLGIGVFPLHGEAVPEGRSNLILTPMSIVFTPWEKGSGFKSLFLRGETTRIEGGLGQPGSTASTFSSAPEWNVSFGVGFDLRR